MSHLTHNRSFRGQVFPANHMATILTNHTYNTQDKHKKPKDKQKKPKTKPNKTKPTQFSRHPARKWIGSILTKTTVPATCTGHTVLNLQWQMLTIDQITPSKNNPNVVFIFKHVSNCTFKLQFSNIIPTAYYKSAIMSTYCPAGIAKVCNLHLNFISQQNALPFIYSAAIYTHTHTPV